MGPAPSCAVELIAEHRWRQSTLAAYDGTYKRWETHCAANGIAPCATPPPVFEAISWLEQRRLAGEINGNTARAQLSSLRAYWALAGAYGDTPILSSVTRAWSRSAGPTSRYLDVPDDRFVQPLMAIAGDPVAPLYQRLVIVLRFIELLRAHDITCISPSAVQFTANDVSVDIRGPKQGDIILRRKFAKNTAHPELCLVSLLRRAMALHQQRRATCPFVPDRTHPRDTIMLSSKAPFRPLAPATLNKLVDKALRAIGVPPHFRPHILRHWGASLMALAGLSTDEILRRGGWAAYKSFALFYNKTLAARAKDPSEAMLRVASFAPAAAAFPLDPDNNVAPSPPPSPASETSSSDDSLQSEESFSISPFESRARATQDRVAELARFKRI